MPDEATGGVQPRVAVVTGASRGIGYAVAKALVARGDRVLITGRNPSTLAAAAGELRTIAIPGKAQDEAHQREVIATALGRFGRLDYLVNTVGISPVHGPVIDLQAATVSKILEVNVIAPIGWIQNAVRAWMGAHGGAIVNVASAAALAPSPGYGAYGMSKAALCYITRQLATELGPNVRVNAVAPAIVRTRFSHAAYDGRESEMAGRYPAGRLGLPDDVASAVAFLLSEAAAWITGQVLVLDGGATLVGPV